MIDEAHVLHGVYRKWLSGDRPNHSLRAGPVSMVRMADGHMAVDFREACHGAPLFIGLTATPGTKGLGKFYDDLVRSVPLTELIANGYLVPMRVYAPSHPDLSGIEIVGDDYNQGQLAERMNQGHLVADAVQSWLAIAEGRPTLGFATNRAHAQRLHKQFVAAGVSAAYVDADTPRAERDAIGEALRARTTQVVINIGTLTTGIDWDVRCIQMWRPTKSRMLFTQMIGRGLRTADGKADCIILDHSDNHLRLGMVTDIRFSLDDGKPKPKAKAKQDDDDELPLPKCCKACSALMPAGALSCLACGAEAELPVIHTVDGKLTPFGKHHLPGVLEQIAAAGVSLRIREDGRLGAMPAEKITPAVREIIARHRDPLIQALQPKDRRPVREKLQDLGKQAVLSMLNAYAKAHDHKPGWVAHKYRAIFEVWPRGLDEEALTEPSAMLVLWLKSERLRWVHSKGAAHAEAA
jgi:hypothetical protein